MIMRANGLPDRSCRADRRDDPGAPALEPFRALWRRRWRGYGSPRHSARAATDRTGAERIVTRRASGARASLRVLRLPGIARADRERGVSDAESGERRRGRGAARRRRTTHRFGDNGPRSWFADDDGGMPPTD
jgi:hypothetical protein